jgi:hypothetical protein
MLYIVFGAAFFLRLAKEKDVPNPSEVELSKTKMLQIANEKYTILQPKTTPLFLKKINKYRPYFPPFLTSN